MPKRSYSVAGAYRYGFNGKENDNDVKGLGNEIDYGMRVYDPRIGKFLSVDPLQKQFPWLTPYQFSANSPILFIDLDGLEPMVHVNNWKHLYLWTKSDYHEDGFTNYFTLKEKDSKDRPYLVRTRIIGSYPYTSTQYQYYDYDQKDYEYFVPTGFEPNYVQNLRNLDAIGSFGRTFEKGVVIAALGWNPWGREILANSGFGEAIDKRNVTSTRDRAKEIHTQADLPKRQNDALTVVVADAVDADGNNYRLVAINSSAQKDSRIMNRISLKPNEILVPNMLGGKTHAEGNLEEFSKKYGLRIISMDASRPYCKNCAVIQKNSNSSTETPKSKKDPKPKTETKERIRRR